VISSKDRLARRVSCATSVVQVLNWAGTTTTTTAATTGIGRTEKADNAAPIQTTSTGIAAGVPTGKSGKGRAAKRQRLQRAQAHVAVQQADCVVVGEEVARAGEALEAGANEPRNRQAAPSAVRTPLAELVAGEARGGATVTGMQSYGAFIDVGAAKDGLLPMRAQTGVALAVGHRLAVVYIAHVDLSLGRVTLSLAPPGDATPRRGPRASEPRASSTSSVSGESVAESAVVGAPSSTSRSSRNSRSSNALSSASTRAPRNSQLKEAAIESLAAALALAPEGVWIDGSVASLTSFGAFVTLARQAVDEIMAACHRDGLIAVQGSCARIDGLLHTSELALAYRAGLIGAAGDADGLAVGQRVRVRVVEVDRQKQQLRLALRAPAPSCARAALVPIAADHALKDKDQDEEGEESAAGLQPTHVDDETLAARVQWKRATEEPDQAEAPPIAVLSFRRLPGGRAFRRLALVELPWKLGHPKAVA